MILWIDFPVFLTCPSAVFFIINFAEPLLIFWLFDYLSWKVIHFWGPLDFPNPFHFWNCLQGLLGSCISFNYFWRLFSFVLYSSFFFASCWLVWVSVGAGKGTSSWLFIVALFYTFPALQPQPSTVMSAQLYYYLSLSNVWNSITEKLYEACRWETGRDGGFSGWCHLHSSLFTQFDIEEKEITKDCALM